MKVLLYFVKHSHFCDNFHVITRKFHGISWNLHFFTFNGSASVMNYLMWPVTLSKISILAPLCILTTLHPQHNCQHHITLPLTYLLLSFRWPSRTSRTPLWPCCLALLTWARRRMTAATWSQVSPSGRGLSREPRQWSSWNYHWAAARLSQWFWRRSSPSLWRAPSATADALDPTANPTPRRPVTQHRRHHHQLGQRAGPPCRQAEFARLNCGAPLRWRAWRWVALAWF